MSVLATPHSGPVLSLPDLRAFDPRAHERAGESDFCCPLCGGEKPVDQAHRSLSANLITGAWQCHRCGQQGKLRDFWTDPSAAPTSGYRRRPAAPPPLKPPTLAALNALPADLLPPISERFPCLAETPGADYLAGRGLPLSLCVSAGVRYANDWWRGRPAVLFPITRPCGAEIAAQGRYLSSLPDRSNFRNTEGDKSGVFAAPGAWEAPDLTITEAPIDALSLSLSGYPALALVGKSWPEWLPAYCASMRKRVYLALDADAAGDEAAGKLSEALRYYACRSERLRPGRAKDWNAQLLEVQECRRLSGLFTKQITFLEADQPHPKLSRAELLTRARATLNALTAACAASDGPEALGYDDGPLDPFAADCLPLWEHTLNTLQEKEREP